MTNKGKSFFCGKWNQRIPERLCMHRFKKGLKLCKGCTKGEALVAQEIHRLKIEQLSIAD